MTTVEKQVRETYKKITGKRFNSRTADIVTRMRGHYAIMCVENCKILDSTGQKIEVVAAVGSIHFL